MQLAPNAWKSKGKAYISLSSWNRSEGFTLVGSPNPPLPAHTHYLWKCVLTDLKGRRIVNGQRLVSEGLHPEAGRLAKIQGHQINKLGTLLALSVGFSVYLAQHRTGCRSKYKLVTSKALIRAFQSLLPNGFIISCSLFSVTPSFCIL